jgi:hypothetical protein
MAQQPDLLVIKKVAGDGLEMDFECMKGRRDRFVSEKESEKTRLLLVAIGMYLILRLRAGRGEFEQKMQFGKKRKRKVRLKGPQKTIKNIFPSDR